jgi:hypothetical protein
VLGNREEEEWKQEATRHTERKKVLTKTVPDDGLET